MKEPPGFKEEPCQLEVLEQALHVVEADVRATGLDGPVGSILNDWDDRGQVVHVVFQGGGSGSTVGIHPADASDPVGALVAVADDLQNSIMHVFWPGRLSLSARAAWPITPGRVEYVLGFV